MRELYNYIDYKSRNAAENIRIEFDENAWDKMEMMLDKDDENPVVPAVPNTSSAVTGLNQNERWLILIVLLFLIGIASVFTKNYFTSKNEGLPLVKTNGKTISNSADEDLINTHVKQKHFVNKHVSVQRPGNNTNKNFRSQATFDNKITLSQATNKIKKIGTGKNKFIAKENNLFTILNEVQESRDYDLPLTKKNESKVEVKLENKQRDWKEINSAEKYIGPKPNIKFTEEERDSNQRHIIISPGVNTKHRSSSSLKNKFFKNLGFSAFVFPEMSSVKFKSTDRISTGYGAGINYTIGKHFTLQAQFFKTRKLYVTDRRGYSPVAGSSLISIDTLKVNADCKVWDIPVNLRYNFKSNIKNDFFISAGLSSYIMKKEVYDFDYYNRGIYETKQRIIENENKHGFCNLNLSVGYQYWLNKKWSIGFEPYLKLPLTGIGAGKVKLTSAGVLFNLTFKPMK